MTALKPTLNTMWVLKIFGKKTKWRGAGIQYPPLFSYGNTCVIVLTHCQNTVCYCANTLTETCVLFVLTQIIHMVCYCDNSMLTQLRSGNFFQFSDFFDSLLLGFRCWSLGRRIDGLHEIGFSSSTIVVLQKFAVFENLESG